MGDLTFAGNLLHWYDVHARVLPWRIGPADRARGVAPDPYRIWLSEVMLQQTTIASASGYYRKFLDRWPTVHALAEARSEDVMGAWAGLGYYARARNLHACAKTVADAHGGVFPRTASALRDLPGIGDYTAAAVAAIAFDEPATVVDGNVERVVTRLFCIEAPLPASKPVVRRHADTLTPQHRAGDFAQAMMDLGSTICTPRKPSCMLCPVTKFCSARAANEQERFPVKAPKKPKRLRRGAAFVAFRPSDGAVLLRKRPPKGMLGDMAEPLTTGWSAAGDGATGADAAPFPANWTPAGNIVHVFTHFSLDLDVYVAEIETDEPPVPGWWSRPVDLSAEALPTLMRKAIETARRQQALEKTG